MRNIFARPHDVTHGSTLALTELPWYGPARFRRKESLLNSISMSMRLRTSIGTGITSHGSSVPLFPRQAGLLRTPRNSIQRLRKGMSRQLALHTSAFVKSEEATQVPETSFKGPQRKQDHICSMRTVLCLRCSTLSKWGYKVPLYFLQIALDAYKVLGLGRMATTTSITQAYDRLIMGQPAEQISQVRLTAVSSARNIQNTISCALEVQLDLIDAMHVPNIIKTTSMNIINV